MLNLFILLINILEDNWDKYSKLFANIRSTIHLLDKHSSQESCVAIMAESSYNWIVVYLATIISGRKVLIISSNHKPEILHTVLMRYNISILFTNDCLFAEQITNAEIIDIDLLEFQHEGIFIRDAVELFNGCKQNEDEVVVIQFSSGTTELYPKNYHITYKELLDSALFMEHIKLGSMLQYNQPFSHYSSLILASINQECYINDDSWQEEEQFIDRITFTKAFKTAMNKVLSIKIYLLLLHIPILKYFTFKAISNAVRTNLGIPYNEIIIINGFRHPLFERMVKTTGERISQCYSLAQTAGIAAYFPYNNKQEHWLYRPQVNITNNHFYLQTDRTTIFTEDLASKQSNGAINIVARSDMSNDYIFDVFELENIINTIDIVDDCKVIFKNNKLVILVILNNEALSKRGLFIKETLSFLEELTQQIKDSHSHIELDSIRICHTPLLKNVIGENVEYIYDALSNL